jgi:flagellar basal body-associated protein FliL
VNEICLGDTFALLLARLTVVAVLLAALAGVSPAQAAAKAKPADTNATSEIEAKAPADYVFLPRLHMVMEVDSDRRQRTLDLEVWLHPKDAQNLQLANSKKKLIAAAIREDLADFNWEAFEDADNGPKVARRAIEATVERVSGVQLDDVLIKTLILK